MAINKNYLIPFVLTLILLIGSVIYVYRRISAVTTSQPTIITAIPSPIPTGAQPSIVDTSVPGQKRYTNPEWGLTFLFPTVSNGETFDIKQDGNKIYVYNTKYPYTQGQYLQYFPKNSSESLTQALQNQLLTGISPSDCFVKATQADKEANFPPSSEIKTLGFPVDENSDIPAFAQTNKCPQPYAETNGLSYFLANTTHPQLFLFFSIGQYGIEVDSQTHQGWQDTIQFIQ